MKQSEDKMTIDMFGGESKRQPKEKPLEQLYAELFQLHQDLQRKYGKLEVELGYYKTTFIDIGD